MTKQNLSSGRWCVAWDGLDGWHRDGAIGDGITAALRCLVTRCETRREARALSDALTEAQPEIMPGTPDVPTFAVMRYCRTDYLSQQQLDHGPDGDHARRVMNVKTSQHLHRGLITD